MYLKKNDIIDLTISSATAEGNGVGKTEDGIAIFVPNSAIGDKLKVRILKTKKTYAFGKIEEIVTPSPTRTDIDCPYFAKCGGCVWRHINYDAECEIKQQRVEDAIKRLGGFTNIEIQPIIKSENTLRYRNKAQFPIGTDKDGKPIIGFYAFHTHRIVDCMDCALQPEIFTQIMNITREFLESSENDIYNEQTHKGKLRHLYIRMGEITKEIMVCYVVNGKGLKQEDRLIERLKAEIPNLKSVIINTNREQTNVILGNRNRIAYGTDYITDELCGYKFKISPFSFWQVNRRQAEKLYNKATEYAKLSKDSVLLDLYCGTGTIGLTMANNCKSLIGVEIIEDAIKDAIENAKINGIENARFICADASTAAEQLKNEGLRPDVVILDPPRKGCGEELVQTIKEMSPQRVVYVSCDPATLARDLKHFSSSGYEIQEITPCDMFSRTAHVETVCLLSRNK
ncbi:MAG: 23S rRNA (uracil(1939)-C(5))-methyltransferase RlmD [Ruminococcus sp.]|nr:23S rRNA (uracil(1939)-C(5))-methyltransferase RlmD [Ruminococcus sp.]